MHPRRVGLGTICFSNSTHLLPSDGSKSMKPVTFPPGRERLATKRLPIESVTATNTMGIVRVSRSSAATAAVCVTNNHVELRVHNFLREC